ncbi:MAG: hypothetical protein N2689_13530, partial [Verrucomicrobiae bacterium]|nr:hypothetical protein [Verrucomicrobiae bacterium]
TTARRWSATNVKASYGGIGLSGQATLITPEKPRESVYETLRASTLKAALDGETDVKALMTAASAWGVPLGDLGGSGPLTAHVETDGAISSLACKPLRVESKGITLTGKAMESIRWPITLALDGSMTLDPLDPLGTPIQIQSATARGPGLDITTMKGVLALDPASDKTDLEIAGQFDPVALASALPGYFKEIALQSGAGPVSLRLRGSLTGAGTEVVAKLDLPETSVQIASAGQNAMALGKPALDVDAKVDTRTGSYQISRASLKTALAARDARADVALDKEGKLAKLDARADGAAELAKLRDLVVAMGLLTNTTELAGNVKLAANVTAGQGGFPYTIQASAPGLHFKGPQTGGVAIDEPEPVLNVKGLFANTKDGFMVSIAEGSELQMQTARAKLSGTLRKQKDQPFYADNLVADATYNPPKLKPLLKAFNAGEILATDQQAARLVFTGPLQPGKDIAAWLASLTLSSKMGYQAYSHTGVKVEGDPLAADMRAGKLPLDYTCKINGGSASVKGELNAQGPQSRAQMKVEKLALNVEMAPLLGYLSPLLFAKKGQLEGQASASFDGTWTGPLNTNPLPESGVTNAASFTITDLLSQRLSGRGQLAVKDLKITGAPLLNMILQYLGTGTDAQVGEIEPTDFVVEKGCLSYQKMVIKLSGMMITLSGKINFDQTMQMQISLPFPAKIREQNKELAKYLGESLTVPLTGTLSSPKLDTSQALQAALKDAGSKALKEKGGDMLKGLFNKSDKDAKPSGTTTPPSATTPPSSGTSAPKEKAGDMLKGLFKKSDTDKKPSGTTTP